MATDFYQELGVSKQAGEDEIRKAYRKLAAQFHPDRNPGNAEAEARFKRVNRAHEVIGNKERRALYDEFGEEGLREGFNPQAARAYGVGRSNIGGVSLDDILGGGFSGFGDMFGEAFRGRGQSRRGADAVADVQVDFVSAIKGANVKVRVPGVADGVTVRVPPGAGDGDKVRVAGHGSPGAGGRAGDLVLTIRVEPHEYFERDGLDLKLSLPISVGEAYHGSKVRVPTPDGDVTLTVPAGVTSGKAVRLRGRGVRRQDKVGDLYVTFVVQLPPAGSSKVDKAIDVVAEATDLSARDAIKF